MNPEAPSVRGEMQAFYIRWNGELDRQKLFTRRRGGGDHKMLQRRDIL
jgi:hypothetical protein